MGPFHARRILLPDSFAVWRYSGLFADIDPTLGHRWAVGHQIAVHVCLQEPDFKEMQGLKGKMFKMKFRNMFMSGDSASDPKEMEKARAQAAGAYTRLSEVRP